MLFFLYLLSSVFCLPGMFSPKHSSLLPSGLCLGATLKSTLITLFKIVASSQHSPQPSYRACLLNLHFFKGHFYVHSKIQQKAEISHVLSAPTHAHLPSLSTFVTTDEPTLTHYHREHIVYMACSWVLYILLSLDKFMRCIY